MPFFNQLLPVAKHALAEAPTRDKRIRRGVRRAKLLMRARVKITKIETIRLAEFPQLLWLQIGTDQGICGLGETFFNSSAVEAYLHDDLAHQLLGRDPLCDRCHRTRSCPVSRFPLHR